MTDRVQVDSLNRVRFIRALKRQRRELGRGVVPYVR
jgi:hypothetical protein